MQHWILRCKHCKKEYVYCTYGNGTEYGTEEGCSATYCAECQRAIDNALNAIPIKFKPIVKRWRDSHPKVTGYYLSGNSVRALSNDYHEKWDLNRDVFASEKQAKSAFAMAQISQIMANDKRFGGAITDKE